MTDIQRVLLAYALLCNTASVLAFAMDKAAARAQLRRIPERRLHLLALLGGWPGGLLARRLFQHKTEKAGFMSVYRLMAMANVALVGVMIEGAGKHAG